MNRTLLVAGFLAIATLAGCSAADGGGSSRGHSTTLEDRSPTTSAAATPTVGTTAPARSTASLAPISVKARAAGLRDVRSVVPDAVVDLRYATRHNFTGVRLYPRDARCLVHVSMTAGLAKAGRAARRAGLRLVFWDCYRPHSVQVRMFRIVSNPAFVARPGKYARSHEAGRSVDLTLARGSTLLDMGTGFDSFTAKAAAYATRGVSAKAEHNRAILRKIMRAGGLTVYTGEWWHFDGRGAATNRPQLKAPLR